MTHFAIGIISILFGLTSLASAAIACDTRAAGMVLSPQIQSYRDRRAQGAVASPRASLQRFTGVGNRIVYNPTGELLIRGRPGIIARVEALHDEEHTEAMFFQRGPGGVMAPIPGAPVFAMQDPFFSDLGRAGILVGGVKTYPKPDGTGLGYKTVFKLGPDIFNLRDLAEGPPGMKDIRVAAMPDGTFILATRPQGKFDPRRPELDAGPGMVGMTRIRSLDELRPETILGAPLHPELFSRGTWGGINEMRAVDSRFVEVLGHVAEFTGPDRIYYPFVTIWDAELRRFAPIRIILEGRDLQGGISKRPDLWNVIFSGGIDGRILWIGARDAQVFKVDLGYSPFARYRRPKN